MGGACREEPSAQSPLPALSPKQQLSVQGHRMARGETGTKEKGATARTNADTE